MPVTPEKRLLLSGKYRLIHNRPLDFIAGETLRFRLIIYDFVLANNGVGLAQAGVGLMRQLRRLACKTV